MAFNNQGRGRYSDRGDQRSSHPEDQRSTRGYGARGGNGGYQGRNQGRNQGFDPLWKHQDEPVQFADNGFAVVSAYCLRPNERYPQPAPFIDLREFYMAQRQDGGEFLCATSRGFKIPLAQARDLMASLHSVIQWVEQTHPELLDPFDSTEPNDPYSQHSNEQEVPF